MSKLVFTDKQVKEYSNNKYISKITNKTIQFTSEFKIKIVKCNSFREAVEEFEEINLGIDVIGNKRIEQSYYRWKNIYKNNGNTKFVSKETRGRKRIDNKNYESLSLEEKIKYLEKQNEDLQMENVILKKYMPFAEKEVLKNKDVYTAIDKALADGMKLNINRTCKLHSISQSGYYKHLESKKNKEVKKNKDRKITSIIKDIFNKHKSKYGYRRILMEIQEKYPEIKINHKKIRRIMKEEKLIVKIRMTNPYRGIAKATKEHKIFDNKLNREFNIGKPYEKILTDITYLTTSHKKFYLSVAKDSITGEIIAHNLREDLKLDLSLDILKELSNLNLKSKETLIHSDQGVHYTSPTYYKKLEKLGYIQSMSRRGNCLDNAPMESFFGHMKDEIDYKECDTFKDMKKKIDEYMIYYNQQRKQWTRKKMTPVQYRNHLLAI